MSSPVIDAIISTALDGLYARQLSTAHNVANAGSIGFIPLRTQFESELRALVAATTPEALPSALAMFEPTTAPASDAIGRGVRIDEEVAIASETSARYALLIGLLDRSLQLQQLAVRGS